jgi:hypothetical protein
MIAYLVNQTAHPAKKPHTMTVHRVNSPQLAHFGRSKRLANFLHSPNVWFNRLISGQLTMATAR